MRKPFLKAKKANSVFIFQASEDSLKVMEIDAAGNLKKDFVNLEFEPLADNLSQEALSEKVAQIFHRLGYRKQPLIISLPRNQATCRFVNIPALAPQEIAKIVSLQAPRYLPYPASDLITGYQVINTTQDGYSGVNLVIVHKDIITRCLDSLKKINLGNFTAVLSSYGLFNLYNYLAPQDSGSVMLIDIDFNQAELVMVLEKKMIFSRYFKLDLLKENWQDSLFEEIKRSQEAYAKEFSKAFSGKIVFFDPGEKLSQRLEAFKEKMSMPVEILPFASKLGLLESWVKKISNSGHSFTSLIGLGLGGIEDSLSLLPQDLKVKGRRASQYKKNLRKVIFAAAILLIWILAAAKSLDNRNSYLGLLKAELSKISKDARPLEEVEKRLRILESQNAKRISSLDIVTACFTSLPSAVFLTNLSYEEAGQLVLRGRAVELNSVFAFVSSLEKSPELKTFNIKVRYATKNKSQSGEAVNFEIACSKK